MEREEERQQEQEQEQRESLQMLLPRLHGGGVAIGSSGEVA